MTRASFLRCLAIILFSIPAFLPAQKVDLSQFKKGLRFRNIGPAGMSGRITSIDAVHDQPDKMYVGTASGGLWMTPNGGVSWQPLFDKQPVQSIGAVAIDQHNPSIIWAGTGEGNPRNSHNSGIGIYRSPDGGKTWQDKGLKNTRAIHRIIVDPYNSDIVYAAALGSAWGPNPERGVYKTIDGGDNWEKILFIDDTTGCADLIIDPSNPNKLIASMWHFHREPWFFTSGGESSGMYITHDGGKTWEERTDKNGLPKGPLGRIGLGVCHSKPNVVYALVESSSIALYRSDDGGFNWKKTGDSNVGNRPFYYADIYVDPLNENRVYSLWSIVTVSEDGGKTFKDFTTYWGGVHPDHHAFYIHPSNPNLLVDGNDGGLYISRDQGDNWRFVENLALGQFYHINYDMDVPYNVYGGMQDNGSYVGPSSVWASGGIQNHHWQELFFGDGFDVVPVPGNDRYVYAMSQGGNVNLINKVTGKDQKVQPVHPEGKPLRFNWNAAIQQSPFDSSTVYFGSQYLHKSTNCGSSWEIISPDLTTNDTAHQKQAKSGGLTIDATRAENFTTITAIGVSPQQKDLVWVGTDDGNLQLTLDGGKNWNNLFGKLPGAPAGAWVPQIVPSSHTPGEAFVVVNDYRRNNWAPYLYLTRDFGKTWSRIADENSVDGYCLSIIQDPVVESLLFLGTDHGLYVSFDYGAIWNKWTEGFPSVPTRDLKIHPREHDLIAATFGRSVWILDDITPLREIAKSGENILKKPFHLFPVQDTWNGEWKSHNGGRYQAQANFRAPNRSRSAYINIWVPKPEGKDKIKIRVMNARGDTVRNWTTKVDTNLIRKQWRLTRNGQRGPSYSEPREDANPPSGPRVPPGAYTIEVVYKKDSAQSEFVVNGDPRDPVSAMQIAAREQKVDDYYRRMKPVVQAFDQLREAKKTISRVENMIVNVEDTLQDSIKSMGKILKDSISTLMELYMTPEDFKGYDHVTERLGDKMWNAYSFLLATNGAPTKNGEDAIKNFLREGEGVVKRINAFFREDWKKYENFVNSVDKPLFKPVEPVDWRR